jgi:hypothetical protein
VARSVCPRSPSPPPLNLAPPFTKTFRERPNGAATDKVDEHADLGEVEATTYTAGSGGTSAEV